MPPEPPVSRTSKWCSDTGDGCETVRVTTDPAGYPGETQDDVDEVHAGQVSAQQVLAPRNCEDCPE